MSERLELLDERQITSTVLGPIRALWFEDTAAPPSDGFPIIVGILGNVTNPENPPLTRLHSACLYSRVLFSAQCDCQQQLELAMRRMREAGSGIIMHMEQEGRGAGLYFKGWAYQIEAELGLDTAQTYDYLEREQDTRTYDGAAAVLHCLGIHAVQLMTNNTRKINGLTSGGIQVIRRPLITDGLSDAAQRYFDTKVDKFGHLPE